jgi:hypothetical protein
LRIGSTHGSHSSWANLRGGGGRNKPLIDLQTEGNVVQIAGLFGDGLQAQLLKVSAGNSLQIANVYCANYNQASGGTAAAIENYSAASAMEIANFEIGGGNGGEVFGGSHPEVIQRIQGYEKDANLLQSVEGTTAVHVRVYNSVAQAVASGTGTQVTFNSERADTHGMHSTSSNPQRLTCTVAGSYRITAHIIFSSNVNGFRAANLRLYAGGSAIIAITEVAAINGDNTAIAVSTDYDLAVGDYVVVEAYQNSGVSLDLIAVAGYPCQEFGMTRYA